MRSSPGHVGVAAGLLCLMGAGAPPKDPVQTSINQLRTALHGEGQVPLTLLASLRQLHDPTLRSFFLQLAHDGAPPLRIHAILGLAEIEPDGHIDPWLVSQLESADARYLVIDNAAQYDLLDTPQIKELLGWNDLEPRARVQLNAELLARQEPLDRESLQVLAGNDQLAVSGLAAFLLAQIGNGAALEQWRTRLAVAPPQQRASTAGEMIAATDIFKLDAAVDWVAATIEAEDADPNIVAGGVATLLALDPERGLAAWRHALGPDADYARRVRYGMILLGACEHLPAEAYDAMPGGDPLLDAMANAGRGITTGEGAASALIELASLQHPLTTAWVLKNARNLDREQATLVYGHILDHVEDGDAAGRDRRSSAAFVAAAHLFDINPDAVIQRLERAADDSLTQQAILTGLLESDSPQAGEAARLVDRIGFGLTDSLALLLIAKHAESLADSELRQLGVIACGGGLLSPTLQAQAAWLYLKHSGNVEQALVTLFTAEPAEGR